MNILLTNDDGINCEGILMLAKILRQKRSDTITVLAPDSDRSGVSHCFSIFREVTITEQSTGNWTCSGMPVDCVIAAVLGGLAQKPDLIVSGINRGANIGSDLLYSGTAAAARQGAFFGIPSIALSLHAYDNFNWEAAANYSADHLDEFAAMWEADTFINVNIPNSAMPGGIVQTRPARKIYNDSLSITKSGDKTVCRLVPGRQSAHNEEDSDWEAVENNLVSVSMVYIHPVAMKDVFSVKQGG